MSNLIDEITRADEDLRAAEAQVAEASRRLRHAKRELHDRREELSILIRELKTGVSRYPLLEAFAANGDRLAPTQDEHLRRPTAGPTVDAARAAKELLNHPRRSAPGSGSTRPD